MKTTLATIGLLVLSNIFMTFAWYGHLKFKEIKWLDGLGLFGVIVISWAITFFEYCLQVPANRMGHGFFTAPQLKTIQEAITFFVFIGFSIFYLQERPSGYDLVAFFLIFIGVAVSVFQPR